MAEIEKSCKKWHAALCFAVGMFTLALGAWAAPVTVDEAATAVGNWLSYRPQLGCRLGSSVAQTRTCMTTNGAAFHVIKLEGGGFVVTSSDTGNEPIIAFSESDDLVESKDNPLWVMLQRDFSALAGTARQLHAASANSSGAGASASAQKWAKLLPKTSTNGTARLLHASTGLESVSDVRVAPLLKSKWSQEQDSYYSNMGDPCYNYYTPNHYPCGCVATATAQVMRYHEYPTASVTPGTYECEVDWRSCSMTMAGGTYDWNSMPLIPDDGTTEAQRQAIGKLTSDVGISCLMSYASGGSSTGGYMAARCLPDRFGYANAVAVCDGNLIQPSVVCRTLCSNLDAKLPVIAGLSDGASGHAVVADGYGYSMSTLYVHFNFGWAGKDDAWYAPPNVAEFNLFETLVFNVYPEGLQNGVICSGRVTDGNGSPLAKAEVCVKGDATATMVSDAHGIYAFILSPGTYTITSGNAAKTVKLTANVGTKVNDDGSYQVLPYSVNNLYGVDLVVTGDEPEVVTHTVTFVLGEHGTRTGGGELVQTVEDGAAAVAPIFTVLDGWEFTGWDKTFDSVTSDLTVTAQYAAASVEVRAGAWTTDVDAVKAAKDCNLVVVLCANYGGCWWSQQAQPIFEGEAFLSWAAENGVYLVTTDTSRLPAGSASVEAADILFSTLYWSVSHPDGYVYYPSIAIAKPSDLSRAVGYSVVRNDGEQAIGGVPYDGTAASLIMGLSTYLVAEPEVVTHTVTFVLGEHGTRTGGGELVQTVEDGAAAVAPIFTVLDGWEFTGWDRTFDSVTSDLTVTAQYESVADPVVPPSDWVPVLQPDTIIGYFVVSNAERRALVAADGSQLAAFAANGECRGVANVINGPNGKLFSLSVGIASATESGITLKCWDAEAGKAYDVDSYIIDAGAGEQIGRISDPEIITIGQKSGEYSETIDGIVWVYYVADGECELRESSATQDDVGTLKIPDSLGGCPVTSIGEVVFAYRSGLTGVIMPSSVVNIGDFAFAGCSGLIDLTIPSGVTNIGACAFAGCSGLTSVSIPYSVISIGESAFMGCSGLMSISVDAENLNYKSANGLLLTKDGRSLLRGVNGNWVIPDGVTCIVDGAFAGLHKLTSVKIPQSVTSIGDSAFSWCDGLTSVTIPSSVNSIGICAFAGCSGLTSIDVEEASPNYKSVNGQLLTKDGKMLVQWIGGAGKIPDTVVSIGDYAFAICTNLTSVTIPSGVTNIGESAFAGCSELTSVTIPSNVVSIGEWAFSSCEKLQTVYVDKGDAERVRGLLIGALDESSLDKIAVVERSDPETPEDDPDDPEDDSDYHEYVVGCKVMLDLGDDYAGYKATGLPTGLKFASKDLVDKTFGEISAGTVYGVPTKAGTYAVTIMKKGESEVRTLVIDIDAAPAWAIGTFNGRLDDGSGSATLTVAANGKISGKIIAGGKTWSFSTSGYETDDGAGELGDYALSIAAVAKSGKLQAEVLLVVGSDGVMGTISGEEIDGVMTLWRNEWKDVGATDKLIDYVGLYTVQLAGDDSGYGYLSLTVNEKGACKATGKLPDGTSASATLPLVWNDEYDAPMAIWQMSPSAYKGGYVGGVLLWTAGDSGATIDSDEIAWVSYAPTASGEYGEGFERVLSANGAYYNKLATLSEYYTSLSFGAEAPMLDATVKVTDYDEDTGKKITTSEMEEVESVEPSCWSGLSVSLNANGTAFVVDQGKATKPTKDKETKEWLYDGDNDAALTLSFAKATGIFKGSFTCWYDYVSATDNTKDPATEKLTHVSKKVSYEGVMVVGESLRGFYLWERKGVYEDDDTGKTKTFKYKESHPVMFE